MDTGILSNPAPDNGFNAVLAALAPQSAPAEGTLAGTTPSVHNRVKQTFVNPVATYPFIVAKWRHGWEQSFHTGDLMFIYTGEDAARSSKSVIMANLPILNHIMTMNQGSGDHEIKASFQECKNWTFIGVMRNSAVASNRQVRHPQTHRGSNRFAAERIINVDVRGSTRMFNYWADAHAGARLFLVWRRVRMESTMGQKNVVMNDSRGMKRQLSSSSEDVEAPDNRTFWQLLPYSPSANHRSDKVWWNEQSILFPDYKRPVCVGFVFQSLGAREVSDEHVAIRKATQLANERFQLPMIHSFLNV